MICLLFRTLSQALSLPEFLNRIHIQDYFYQKGQPRSYRCANNAPGYNKEIAEERVKNQGQAKVDDKDGYEKGGIFVFSDQNRVEICINDKHRGGYNQGDGQEGSLILRPIEQWHEDICSS